MRGALGGALVAPGAGELGDLAFHELDQSRRTASRSTSACALASNLLAASLASCWLGRPSWCSSRHVLAGTPTILGRSRWPILRQHSARSFYTTLGD